MEETPQDRAATDAIVNLILQRQLLVLLTKNNVINRDDLTRLFMDMKQQSTDWHRKAASQSPSNADDYTASESAVANTIEAIERYVRSQI